MRTSSTLFSVKTPLTYYKILQDFENTILIFQEKYLMANEYYDLLYSAYYLVSDCESKYDYIKQ